MGVKQMYGVDLHGTVEPPTTVKFESNAALYAWFNDHPQSATTHTRLLCVRLKEPGYSHSMVPQFDIPLPQSIVESAIWRPEVYGNLAANPAGGAAGLIDEPWRFIVQTPLDGGPFCSLALSRKGNVVKGIYFFDEGFLDPSKIAEGDSSHSSWRSSGLQIIAMPHQFLQAHSLECSRRLARVISKVRKVERELMVASQTSLDFSNLSRTLHTCNLDLVDIERRSRFENSVIEAIETMISASPHATLPWSALGPQRTALASRQFDFESLPRRIENARTTISSLLQQRTEALNLELTQASHEIAEATLSDSRSMKTIAIMTMVLLPGTAVASLFSMNLFNWTATDGDHIASKWLWIYFVVTIPLTGFILASWWFWNRRSSQLTRSTALTGHGTPRLFTDEEVRDHVPPASDLDCDDSKPSDHS